MATENDGLIAALRVLRIVLLVVLSPVWVPVVVAFILVLAPVMVIVIALNLMMFGQEHAADMIRELFRTSPNDE